MLTRNLTLLVHTLVYKIPYRRVRAWPSARASKGILHTIHTPTGVILVIHHHCIPMQRLSSIFSIYKFRRFFFSIICA